MCRCGRRQDAFACGKHLPVFGLGLGVPVLGCQFLGDLVAGDQGVGVVGAERLLEGG